MDNQKNLTVRSERAHQKAHLRKKRAHLIADKRVNKDDLMDNQNNPTVKSERAHQQAHLTVNS